MLGKIKGLIGKLFYTKEILDKTKATYHGVMFAQAIQDCLWLKNKGFSFGDFGWAMDALALHNMFRILEDVKPKNILEFGLGQSSKMVHQYAEYQKANALTVEHDKDWIDYIKTHAPQINFNICQANLEKIEVNGIETYSYKNIAQIFMSAKIGKNGGNLVILDGYSNKHYSRPQVLDFVSELGEDFCIFMHDSERTGEQETLVLLYEKLNQSGVEFLKRDYDSTKRHTIICSKSWKFLTSI